jgi:hypothetical protein
MTPTFTPDKGGAFTIQLIVNDGTVNSAADTMTINVTNRAPTANAGGPYTVTWAARNPYTISGASFSDPDGDTLTYAWTQTGGTAVTLNAANTATPNFVMATPGTYTFSVIVYDDESAASGASAATATNSIATYTTNWNSGNDSGGLTWVATQSSNAGENGIDSNGRSGNGWHMQSCDSSSCTSYAKVTNYAGRYVYTVSYYAQQPMAENKPQGPAGLFEGETLRVSYPGKNSWTPYSWNPNAFVTDLNFRINGPGLWTGGRGNMHVDDISVQLWN